MRVMSVGLASDAAVAELELDRPRDAVLRLAECLERLDAVNSDESTAAAYVHRVVRHTILWAYNRVTGGGVRLATGEPVSMCPGAGSNPEPDDAVKTLPLTPLDVAWYLLAQVDVESDASAGVSDGLAARLGTSTIPALEVTLRHDRLASAIRRSDAAAFAAALSDWVAARLYLAANRTSLREQNLEAPSRGIVPPATADDFQSPLGLEAAVRAVAAFGVAAVTAGRASAVRTLITELRGLLGTPHPVMSFLDQMTDKPPRANDVRDTAGVVAFLLEPSTRDPVDLMVATIRLIEAAAGSDFERTLAPSIADWIGREWAKVVENQAFSLRSPRVTCPAILDAVRTSERDLASAARIALASIPAVQIMLDPRIESRLIDIARRADQTSIAGQPDDVHSQRVENENGIDSPASCI